MNRRTVEVILVAALAVLVLSIASATLNSTSASGGGGGLGEGNNTGLFPDVEVNLSGTTGGGRPPALVVAVTLALAGLLVVWYLVTNPRRTLALFVGTAILLVAGFLVLALLAELFGGELGGGSGGGIFGGGGDGVAGGSETGSIAPGAIEVLAILAIGVIFVGVLLRTTSEADVGDLADTPPREEDVDLDAIARTAGRAADRIEGDAAVDNEVFRAWREMTDLLDVPDPETSTPREFADAAVAAGMDEADVTELTVLFEEVRYGTEEPTRDREHRAVDALRRIESYAEDDT